MNFRLLNPFLFLSIIFVHFDPIGFKITIPFFFLIYLSFSYVPTINTLKYTILSFIVIIIIFINLLLFENFNLSNFISTFVLLIFSLFFHIHFSTCSIKSVENINYRYFNFSLNLIFIICLLQFITFKYFNTSFFFNLFGKFSYLNQYDLSQFGVDYVRVNALYLEPSYLAFVVINLYLYLYLLNKLKFVHTLILILILIMAGSRGGFIFFGLFFIATLMTTNTNMLIVKNKFLLFLLFIPFIYFVLFSTDTILILSPENILTENTSQFDRIYLGYLLSENVLLNYPFGIPLGQIEIFFEKLFGFEGTVFNFLYLLTIYFGYFGIVLLCGFIIKLFFSYKLKSLIFILIYLLMYFMLTGSLLAPDTYFWFVIFIILFRNFNKNWIKK